ncbi:MAG: glycoside hydrolase family 127 protein [Kiritimatiellaeota bacterium]|nr:glycoside hydrolase family 127 protein [Kiritimatiellota bacterium]
MKIQIIDRPGQAQSNFHYPGNRPPLLPSPLIKLPLGSVRPQGWLKHQLDLMVEGMTGRLSELSPFLAPDNGWLGGEKEGWEEQPYWFRGFYDLAVLMDNPRCREIADRWINAMLRNQYPDGYFGPRFNKAVTGKNGQTICDLWPHMIMLDAIVHYAEYAGDARVVPFVQRFFAYCRDLPDERFIPPIQPGYDNWRPTIQHARAGDMLPHIYWLYNRTEEPWLLDLARRFYDRITPPESEWLDHHVVNFTQRFQYPGIYYALSHDRGHLELAEYWYTQHMLAWGQQPRGIFSADEKIRPGKVDPRQGFETCGMTEFAKSFYLLGRISGNPAYADRTEDIMLNHFPAAQAPDLKGLHYLTAANMPQLDRNDHDFKNKGFQLPYSSGGKTGQTYRCCQHNVAMGWPWYVQNLWQATGDNGLAAWMYGASEVTAKVGREGKEVAIAEHTDYPFRSSVKLTVKCAGQITFPLYLRVPRWCEGFTVAVNAERLEGDAPAACWVRIERSWRNGDTVEIEMPVKLALTVWPRTGSVTVDRGPLSYSVKIEEDWRRAEGTDEWPQWEVFPKSPWNYGLVIDRDHPAASLKVKEKPVSSTQPWSLDAAPIEIKAKAKRIPNWKLEGNTVQPLQASPIKSDQSDETISLVPLGCARLRMACLPRIEDGPDARYWK